VAPIEVGHHVSALLSHSCFATRLDVLFSNEEQRYRRIAQDSLGIATEQQSVEPASAVRAHHDQIGAPSSGFFQNRIGGMPTATWQHGNVRTQTFLAG
jgi:hypothetical protein